MYYEGKTIEFVPNLTYIGVVMQTKGGYSGHIQNLKRRGISACTRVALRLAATTYHYVAKISGETACFVNNVTYMPV